MSNKTLRNLIIQLSARTDAYRAEMSRASRLGGDFHRSMQEGARRLNTSIRQNQVALNRMGAEMTAVRANAGRLVSVFAGGFAVSSVIDAADNWGQYAARMKAAVTSVEGSADQYDGITARLLEISNRNAKRIEDSQELYITSAKSMQELGYATNETVDFIESMSSAFTANATSSDKVQSSINALNKAMVTGKISALNWNTIASATPGVVSNIAAAMGKTESEVKALGAAGKISMQVFADAVIKAKDANNALADAMDNTVRDGFVKVANSAKAYIGSLNDSAGVTRTLAAALSGIAENFDIVAKAGGALLLVGVSRYFGNLSLNVARATREQLSNYKATIVHAVAQRDAAQAALYLAQAETRQAQAAAQYAQGASAQRKAHLAVAVAKQKETAATKALAAAQKQYNAIATAGGTVVRALKGALSLLGGPMGAAMLAGSALYYFSQKAENARQEALAFGETLPQLTERMGEMNKVQATAERGKLGEFIAAQNEKIHSLVKNVANAEKEVKKLAKLFNSKGEYTGHGGEHLAQAAAHGLTKARNTLVIATGNLHDEQNKLNDAYKIGLNLLVKNIPFAERFTDVVKKAAGVNIPPSSALSPEAQQQIQKALESTSLQLDVATLQSAGLSREASILSGLQQAAGAAALEHRDDLIALAQGQILSGNMSEELAAKLREVAEALGQLYDKNQSKSKSGGVNAAKQTAQAYERQVEQLKQQITLFGQTSELSKLQYQLTNGELKTLSAKQKLTLENYTIELEQLNAKQAYKDLMSGLLTDEEKLIETMRGRLTILDAANLSADEYSNALSRVMKSGFEKPPEQSGMQYEVGGAFGELGKIAEQEEKLNEWHARQLEVLNTFREERADLAEEWDAKEQDLQKKHLSALEQLNRAKAQTMLTGTADMFGSMADLAKTFAGEQSGIYKAMFAVSKGFSIANATLSMMDAIAKANAVGFPANIPLIAQAAAQGASIISTIQGTQLSGMAHDGIDSVPREGTWLLDKGERVVDSRTNEDLKSFLKRQDTPSATGGVGAITFNQVNHINITSNSESGIDQQAADAITQMIKAQTYEILQDQTRPGGMLSQ